MACSVAPHTVASHEPARRRRYDKLAIIHFVHFAGRRRGATDEDGTFYNLAHESSTHCRGSSTSRFVWVLADNIAEFGNSADYA